MGRDGGIGEHRVLPARADTTPIGAAALAVPRTPWTPEREWTLAFPGCGGVPSADPGVLGLGGVAGTIVDRRQCVHRHARRKHPRAGTVGVGTAVAAPAYRAEFWH